MEPNLERLIHLQEICLSIEALERKLASVPDRRQELEQTLAHHRAAVAKAKDELGELQKNRRSLEGDLGLVETKINKYQDQLMAVKTNKEYSAMLTEIENVKREQSALETEILQAMESGDLLEEKIRQEEKALKEEEQQVAADLKRLEEEESDLQTEKKQQEASRKEVESLLQPDLVSEFTKIAQARGGLAVSQVVDGLCRGCSVRIRPHILQQIRRHEGLFHCDNCRRYLYHVEEKGAETPPDE